jgi:hypothetical protein|eukprot:COSAG06_NODE_31_length_31488_cov_60.882793_9_plen_57_part_00
MSEEPAAANAIAAAAGLKTSLARLWLNLLCACTQCPVAVLDRVRAPRVLRMEREHE